MARRSQAAALPFTWQLRVDLLDVTPTVWRRLLVPPTLTLPKLHHALQIALGWTDSHLHEFLINGVRYGVPDPDWQDEWPVMDERRVALHEALGPSVRCFDYVYDFGDDWHHSVVVESLYAPLAPGRTAVYCSDGANACPPEDVGGAPGYAELLTALADPHHEEHQSYLEWIGGAFDPARFDLAAINKALARLKR